MTTDPVIIITVTKSMTTLIQLVMKRMVMDMDVLMLQQYMIMVRVFT